MSDFDVSADGGESASSRVCLTCGAPFEGELEDPDLIPFYVYCVECDEKTYFGTQAEYEHRQP